MAYMVVEPKTGAGTAPLRTVTLLHGKNFSGAYWKSTADRLAAAGYRVVIPDQLGFGKSTKLVDFQYSFQELSRLTQALLEEIGVTESTVVGHSMGGMLGTRFALMYPKQTSKLVLVNPIGLEDWKRVVPYHSVDEWEAINLKSTPDGVREYMKTNYFDGKWKDDYEELVAIQAGWAIGPDRDLIAKVSAEHYHMIFTEPVVYEFPDLRVPTLLVIGQRDTTAIGKGWVSPEVAKGLGRYPELGRAAQAAIPKAKLVELDNIGHVPQVESFDAWIAALLAFLK
jgi:pimeloyl-ACP methyl ester carboxylesterase